MATNRRGAELRGISTLFDEELELIGLIANLDYEASVKAHVTTRYRDANSNLRSRLEWIIAKAGLRTWPKLCQNLLTTRATKLATEYPSHVAAEWSVIRTSWRRTTAG